jgi:YqaJ-like viral recombinase domain
LGLYPQNAHAYLSRAMQRGADTEHEARTWYSFDQDVDVRRVGFITTDDGHAGCSPDGVIDSKKRGLELKCPLPKTHSLYLLNPQRLLMDYKQQAHGGLWVTGFDSWHLMSYSIGMDPVLLTVVPDEYTAALGKALEEFWGQYVVELAKRKPKFAQDQAETLEPDEGVYF